MRLVDLEFSEILELEHRISGGWGFSTDADIDLNIDLITFDGGSLEIDLDNLDKSIEPDTQNDFFWWGGRWGDPELNSGEVGEASVSLYVGDPLIENY